MSNEQPDLLFFDTFSHDTSEARQKIPYYKRGSCLFVSYKMLRKSCAKEGDDDEIFYVLISVELNLDLVQFPKSVYVREIRIIPLGARVEGDFPGGVRLGATNPTKFHIDFFVNDLSKPGASTFEALGSIDYCQNGQIHMECGSSVDQPRIPTDGLVLRGWYTTITLAVYGNLSQVLPDPPVSVNPPPNIQRPVAREANTLPANVPQTSDWNPEPSNPIPAYTNVAASNPEAYGASSYPENYENQMYRSEYYDNEPPKDPRDPRDPRAYHHMEENDWEKERREISGERDSERMRHSPRSLELERDRERRDVRSRRSLDRVRSRESSRHRDRSREVDRLHSRSRSREREYVVKGEYRMSRSRSRSIDRDREWDRGSYKKDDYRRHRDASYERSRGGSYEPRSPYDKRGASYERKIPYEKGPYEKRLSPYDKRSSSYERRAPSYEKQPPYDRKRHSPYSRMRGSSYGSRSPSRDDPRKRPRTPPSESRRPMSPREGEHSPINSVRSDENAEYDGRSGKQIPRIDFYHQSYRHKSSIRSPSQEVENAYPENQHTTTLVTVPIVDTIPKVIESPNHVLEGEQSMDAEPFEPILSDEDICDDLDANSYMEMDYDVNEYCGVEDIIKYFNPFRAEWKKYKHINNITKMADVKSDDVKDVMSASFNELSDASIDLLKIWEITSNAKKREQKFFSNTFVDIDNTSREDWVHQCEQLFVALTNLTKSTDVILRIFCTYERAESPDEFSDIYNLLVTFCKIGLNFEFALAQQQPTYKIRHMKCGIRLAETLMSHQHNGQVMKMLLSNGINIPMQLIEMYSKEYMALSIRLMILKALNACLSSKESIDHFMQDTMYPKFDKNENESSRKPMNGYQALISMMQANPLGRVKFSLSALIKKLNVYEVLNKLHDMVFNLNNSAAEKNEDSELSESDIHFLVDSFEEILYMYRSQCFHLSQPKRFLPVSAQFEISKESSNEILLQFFDIHRTLEVCLYLLTCPTTCNNLVITSPIHDLIFELVNSFNGLKFLYKNMEMSELLFKILQQPYGQQNTEETPYPHDSTLSSYSDLQIVGLELAYRLKALYYLQSISDLQAGKMEENELIDRLQSLYCLSFGSIGKTAVPNVIVMGENSECLMEVFENDLKGKSKSDSPPKQKSPAKGYAIELIVSAVRYAANVPFLKKYGQRLINVSKEHERFEPSVSSVLQEVIPYLKPAEKATVLSGEDLSECVEILKASLEHSADLPGELMTCLRILRHFCISDYEQNVSIVCESPVEEYVELKYKYNLLQLFSLDGVAHISGILDRLAVNFDQPSMHTSFFASVRGLQLAQMLLPCLKLLDEMLARVVRCRGPRFRDLTAAPIILKTYGIAKAFPVGCIGYRTAAKAAEAAVRALLAYAQPIADDAKDGDSIRRGPWTSLCSEVISYIMTAPYTFVPGLLIFSELLPLPLPMQTRTAPSDRELEDAANERRMWSAHLHALSNDLTDMIQTICMSTYRPVVHMLRRVCVQIADLAPNTAATVAKAAVGAVMREIKDGEPASSSVARVLGFLACLVSHAPVKCAVLHNLSSGTTKANEIQTALCNIFSLSNSSNELAAAQEYAAHALAAFCDAEVTLTPLNGVTDTAMANSLPSKEVLSSLLDATADCLESSSKTCAVASSVLRAYFVLTEHEFGFIQFRKFVTRRRESLGKYFKWALEGSGEDKAECLNLYMDLIKILKAEDSEGPVGRKSTLTLSEMADMVAYSPNDEDHPVLTLEKVLKERNSDEDALSNGNFLLTNIQKIKVIEEAELPDPLLPPPEPLVAQFAARQIYCIGDANDERLTTGYWLNVPAATEEDINDTELMSCDIMEIANTHLSGGGEALAAAVRRLAGCLDTRPEAMPCDDKRPPVALSRLRAEGGADAFRSRPPNTSRPPSLHVDDFTALHAPYPPITRGVRRGSGSERGRFGAPNSHYRHLGRGAWELGQHFGHFAPASQYIMGGMGWGGGRMQRGPRHRSFMR